MNASVTSPHMSTALQRFETNVDCNHSACKSMNGETTTRIGTDENSTHSAKMLLYQLLPFTAIHNAVLFPAPFSSATPPNLSFLESRLIKSQTVVRQLN